MEDHSLATRLIDRFDSPAEYVYTARNASNGNAANNWKCPENGFASITIPESIATEFVGATGIRHQDVTQSSGIAVNRRTNAFTVSSTRTSHWNTRCGILSKMYTPAQAPTNTIGIATAASIISGVVTAPV